MHPERIKQPKQDFLYVMQAKDGRVKIGRSVDPEKRRRTLETQGGMRIFLVATLPKRGDDEYELQGALWNYATIGEWVENLPAMWDALNEFLGTELAPVVMPKIRKPRSRYARTDRRILANGTVKEYFYPARTSAQGNKSDKSGISPKESSP